MTNSELEQFRQLFERHGGTDVGYLDTHYRRFRVTQQIFRQTWNRPRPRVLDIGAHWLHQAMLYATEGCQVTAADFGATLELASVRSLAREHKITLIVYDDLEHPKAFADLPDSSFDVVLFTEILEHLTFNPVAMWREIHRLLAPGGRIIVTTPNYYALKGRAWSLRRFLRRLGGGLPVDEILGTPTYGAHWKEYSLREVVRYFTLLSPDFCVHKALYVDDYYDWPPVPAALRTLERNFRVLRRNLHVEVELAVKAQGIVVFPTF